MPTERGILIIRAFHDRNGNGRKDEGEESLREEIVCRVDDTAYDVPAFIPGLRLNGTFSIECEGENYVPHFNETSVFIKHRGQIVQVDLPATSLSSR